MKLAQSLINKLIRREIKMKSIKFVLTDYRGIKQEIEFDKKQVKQLSVLKDIEGKIKTVAKKYSRNYWVKVIIDGKKFYEVQWIEV